MLDRNALESLNENSFIVNNVTDTKSELALLAQAQRLVETLFELSSRTHFFLRKGKRSSSFS